MDGAEGVRGGETTKKSIFCATKYSCEGYYDKSVSEQVNVAICARLCYNIGVRRSEYAFSALFPGTVYF